MGTNHDDLLDPVESAARYSIGMAQGVIAERYGVSIASADAVLALRARAAGIPLVEAARWLLTAGTLP
ncbi:hypothetical protein GCM10029976_039470 [Kribbella albertanoniae]|uniref:ANTAR domain-containing protein n=1 Tax=Kribbella albertanoniae TaxID=1266829 RepID=A0A4R4QAY2_9ACTN|nr:hypothetical protein [Kribbella albertanoniae]TDC32289.1 hypothetical protein E1261_08765 [Kribbella albertanoniae]